MIPGLCGFFSSFSLGMPGVGVVPLVKAETFAGIPGTFAAGGRGLAEMPGGIFAGSSCTATGTFVLPLLVALGGTLPLQPTANQTDVISIGIKVVFDIILGSV